MTCPFPNFNGATVEVWKWISKFIPHFMMDVITYPCWNEMMYKRHVSDEYIHECSRRSSKPSRSLSYMHKVSQQRSEACNMGGLLLQYAVHAVVSWWGLEMETISALLAFCEGNPVDSPHKWPVMRNFDAFFVIVIIICRRNCRWFETPWHTHVRCIVMKP